MAQSRLRRAAQMLRDPWGLLVAAVGGGAAWAVGLPLLGAGGVAVGVLGAAAAVGAMVRPDDGLAEPDLRAGTAQRRMVGTLDGYLDNIRELRSHQDPMVADRATDAMSAGDSAREVSLRVAAAVDDLDVAIGEADKVARTMTSGHRVAGSLDRMNDRRQQLLGKLSDAVDGVGELYTKLLEMGAAAGEPVDAGVDPVAELNDSLDATRNAFAELDAAAGHARDVL